MHSKSALGIAALEGIPILKCRAFGSSIHPILSPPIENGELFRGEQIPSIPTTLL
jgi:hypothetical protein